MTKPIEHRVAKAHREWHNNPIGFSMDVLKQLKDKGVPVVGHAVLEGVTHGRLEITLSDDEYVYRWQPDPAKVKKYDPLNDDEDEEL